MTILAFNTPLTRGVRGKYQAALSVLPFGLMFASFVPLIFFLAWLHTALGTGVLWLVGFLVVGGALMVLGYALGWLANAAIALMVLGWSSEKVVAVFLRSEIPSHWFKQGTRDASDAVARSLVEWEGQRKRGAVRFVITRGIAAWGAPMFLGMYLVPVLLHARQFTSEGLVLNLALWTVAGAAFGATMWRISDASYRKHKGRR